jgi:hypothetical protein
MANYLQMSKKQQVLALLDLGWAHRRIQRETGVDRGTVRAYDRARQIPPKRSPALRRRRQRVPPARRPRGRQTPPKRSPGRRQIPPKRSPARRELPRRLLKISGGSADDYATFSASSFTTPSC